MEWRSLCCWKLFSSLYDSENRIYRINVECGRMGVNRWVNWSCCCKGQVHEREGNGKEKLKSLLSGLTICIEKPKIAIGGVVRIINSTGVGALQSFSLYTCPLNMDTVQKNGYKYGELCGWPISLLT